MTAQLPPPGWHPDPQYPGYQRWWDGTRWTEHRAPLATARSGWSGPPLAGFGKRLAAAIVDGIVVSVPLLVLFGLAVTVLVTATSGAFSSLDEVDGSGGAAAAGFGMVVLLFLLAMVVAYGSQILYAVGFEGGHLGQTPGKWLLGIRVVDAGSRLPTVPSKALLRWLVKSFASGAILALGYLWMLWDHENRTWHDMAADTRVVEARGPRAPLGELLRSWRLRATR